MLAANKEISYYEGALDLRAVIEQADLQQRDEALNVCDLTQVVLKHRTWLQHLPRVKPYYAVKCNDDSLIVQLLAALGANFDCASKNEIKQVLALGVAPERIIFANPCKPASHLAYAREQGVSASTVDNEHELYKIFKHHPESNLILRFRCEAQDAQCPLGDKFGCDADNEAAALLLLAKALQLNVVGASFHVGSGCNDLPAYDRAIQTAKKLFDLGDFLGYDMKVLDIGGGFPGSDDAKFARIAGIINQSLERNFPRDRQVQVIAEPGRFYVAAAYTLVCKIHAKRDVHVDGKLDTKMYYVNDGVYGSFNCILYDHQHVTPMHFAEENAPTFKTVIWGPTCDALDKISENVFLPELRCDDLIAFPNMGAYTVPIASPFNGFMLPKTVYFMQCGLS